MAINKKKIGKKIYFDGEIWDVQAISSPNKFDDYLFLSRKVEKSIHIDDKTIPIDVICIDAHNDTFYPWNKQTKSKIEKLRNFNIECTIKRMELEEKMTTFWLDCFPDPM